MWVLPFTVSQHLYNDKLAFVKACFIALGHNVMQLVHSIVVYRRLIVHTTVSWTVLRLRYNPAAMDLFFLYVNAIPGPRYYMCIVLTEH